MGRFENVYITLASVVVGFVLAVLWDLLKRRREDQIELARALRVVSSEIDINLELINGNIQYLTLDSQAADQSREVVRPIDTLFTAAGETAYLKGILEQRIPEIGLETRRLYQALSILNHLIEQRELYRISNGAMSNFHSRRKLINDEIRSLLEAQLAPLRALKEKINHRRH